MSRLGGNRILLPVAVGLGLLGCGEDRTPVACLAYAAAGLSVQITNGANGQPICDATVLASEGAYSEQLFETACQFVGAFERPGTYRVAASRPDFDSAQLTSVRVVMGGGDCPHVEQVRLTIALAPVRWSAFQANQR
jgi:hypothetical protein